MPKKKSNHFRSIDRLSFRISREQLLYIFILSIQKSLLHIVFLFFIFETYFLISIGFLITIFFTLKNFSLFFHIEILSTSFGRIRFNFFISRAKKGRNETTKKKRKKNGRVELCVYNTDMCCA